MLFAQITFCVMWTSGSEKNSGKFDDKKVLKDDVERLIIPPRMKLNFMILATFYPAPGLKPSSKISKVVLNKNLCNMVAISLPGNSLHTRTEW